jgi:hypothetical protein
MRLVYLRTVFLPTTLLVLPTNFKTFDFLFDFVLQTSKIRNPPQAVSNARSL